MAIKNRVKPRLNAVFIDALLRPAAGGRDAAKGGIPGGRGKEAHVTLSPNPSPRERGSSPECAVRRRRAGMWRAQRSGIPLVSEGFGHFALQVESGSVAGLHFLFDLQRKSASQRVWRYRSAIFCRPATETPADLRQKHCRPAPKPRQTRAKNTADLCQKRCRLTFPVFG